MNDSEKRLMQKNRHDYRDALRERYRQQDLPSVEWATECSDSLIVKADIGDGLVLATRIGSLQEAERVSLMVYGQHRGSVEYSTARDETLGDLELPAQVEQWSEKRLSTWVEAISRAATALDIALQPRLDRPRITRFVEEGLAMEERTGAYQQIAQIENRLGLGDDYYRRPYDQQTRRSLQHGLEVLREQYDQDSDVALREQLTVRRSDDEVMGWLESDPHRFSYLSPQSDESDSRIREANDEYAGDGIAEVKKAILAEQRDIIQAFERYLDRHGPQLQSIIEHHDR